MEFKYVNGVQNKISEEGKEVHPERLRFYADEAVDIMAKLKQVFHHSLMQDKCEMTGTVNTLQAADRDRFLMLG